MKKTFFGFISDQLAKLPPVSHADLSGKTVVVTGANTGLGFEAAKHFARMKPGKLIMACRDEGKGKAASATLEVDTGYSAAEVWSLDLGKFSSVTAFANRFEKEGGGRLDILLANAAISTSEYRVTSDGWEESIQVNHLSTSLLCLLLLPRLLETAEKYGVNPRIVLVNSELHYFTTFSKEVYAAPSALQVLNSKEYLTPGRMSTRYFETKLLNVFFTQSLADLLENTKVVATTVNPGLCISNLRREFTGFMRFMVGIMEKLLARTTEGGSRQLVYACVGRAENPDSLRGSYINLEKVDEPNDHAVGEAGRERRDRFWKELIDELEKVDGRVRNIVSDVRRW